MKFRDLFRSKPAAPPSVAADWETANSLAAAALQNGQLEEAVHRYGALIAQRPDFAEGHYKLGNAFNRMGRAAEALASYDRAVNLNPEYAYAFCNRGTVLERLQRWDEALASYDRALALNPGDAFAWYNRASVLRELRRFDESVSSYDRAIELNGGYMEAYVNRGHLLAKLSRHAAAAASYAKAIELVPDLTAQSRAPLRPEQKFLLGLRRQSLMQICDWRGLDTEREQIATGLRHGLPVTLPLLTLAILTDPALHRAAATHWIREEAPADPVLGVIGSRPRSPKIRIGYFSSDFREHPVAQLTAGVFEQHDRSRFEVTAFGFGPETRDAMQARMSKAFDRFVDVRQRTDVEVASLARELGIDIAVNMNGITEHARTKIFALRAAPLQVNYLGYAGTLGAPYMDYIVADDIVVPRAQQSNYAEKVIYLPGSFMPFDSSYPIAEREFTRRELGLPDAAVVFCCFNNSFKLTPEVFGSWMRILERVEHSVLWLSRPNSAAVDNIMSAVAGCGMDAGRVIFAQRLDSQAEHLARIRAADLFLDTFPYNAHATAVDALWAGVPVLTCAGDSFASRVAASLLTGAGLPQLVTASPADYENLAIALASEPARLRELRATLARARSTASLFDTARYVRKLEEAYQAIHERHLSGAAPAHINEKP